MNTIYIPPVEYDTEFTPGNVKGAKASTGARIGEQWMVPIENIRVPVGLNIRVHDADYEQRVERIKDSIIVNGFYRHMPLKGYVGKEDGKDVIYCAGGFTRLAAAKRAVEAGCPIKELPVVMVPPGTSMVDLTVGLLNDNSGTANTPYEKGLAVKRLIGWGMEEKEISERVGLGVPYIRRLLYLHSLPQALQTLVIQREVRAGYAIQLAQKIGPAEALQQIRDELAEQTVDDPPLGDEDDDSDETLDRARPAKPPRVGRATGITSRVALGAIDYVIELFGKNPKSAFDFLQRWRAQEQSAIEELKKKMSKAKPKVEKEPKKRGRPAKVKPETVLPPPTEEEIRNRAIADMEREAGPEAEDDDDNDEGEL